MGHTQSMAFNRAVCGPADDGPTKAVPLTVVPPPEIHVDIDVAHERPSPREEKMCRICGGDGSDEGLISACECIGSVRWVHYTCLQKWVSTRPSLQRAAALKQPKPDIIEKCEICKAAYTIAIEILPEPEDEDERRARLLAMMTVVCIIFSPFIAIWNAHLHQSSTNAQVWRYVNIAWDVARGCVLVMLPLAILLVIFSVLCLLGHCHGPYAGQQA